MAKRIQRKRTKGWVMPPNTVYVGRGSIWGNPFKGDDAVEKYQKAFNIFAAGKKLLKEWKDNGSCTAILIDPSFVKGLKGKDLACWCPLDKPCHADFLLEIANK